MSAENQTSCQCTFVPIDNHCRTFHLMSSMLEATTYHWVNNY